MARTLLAIGAHYDDCAFGIPGILLQAVRKNYRVVSLALIGDYTAWGPIAGRAQELIAGSKKLAAEHGVEQQFLSFKSHHFEVTPQTKREVAEAVASLEPEIAFQLWPHDSHEDHVVAARLSSLALRGASSILGNPKLRPPRAVYAYDNGPRHTIYGFEPDTFIDITPDWQRSIDWLGRLMALVRNEPYDSARRDSAQKLKESLAGYRGKTCGVDYAEAVHALGKRPVDIL